MIFEPEKENHESQCTWKCTTAWMQEVEQRMEQLPRCREDHGEGEAGTVERLA